MTDYARTVMRQYANSGALNALLAAFDQWVDPAKFTADFLRDVWDIQTARGFGLDNWGRILGMDRFITLPQGLGADFFGFDIGAAPGTQWQPFGQRPFYTGQGAGTLAYALPDADYRRLLLTKAAANIASTNTPALNALLRSLFGDRGACYLTYSPGLPMQLVYIFGFFPSAVDRAIIERGILPAPAGMTVTYRFRNVSYQSFGFDSSNDGVDPEAVTGFDQAPFYNE